MDIYKLQLHEFDNLEADKEANCQNYEKDINKSFKASVVKNQFLKKFGCIPPWFTENEGNFCSETYTVEQWKNMSDYIFPTMDNTFIQVSIECQVNMFNKVRISRTARLHAKQWK